MNKEQIIQGIADRIKAEETKHSHSIPDWHKIAAAKIYATWVGTAIPDHDLNQLADEWVFETNGHKWSNNDDTAGDNYGSFKAGFQKAIELLTNKSE